MDPKFKFEGIQKTGLIFMLFILTHGFAHIGKTLAY